MHHWTVLHYSPFKAAWDWLILILVLYTAIFTPYVAAFLLNEPDFDTRKSRKYGDDPIVIIDLIGMKMNDQNILFCQQSSRRGPASRHFNINSYLERLASLALIYDTCFHLLS